MKNKEAPMKSTDIPNTTIKLSFRSPELRGGPDVVLSGGRLVVGSGYITHRSRYLAPLTSRMVAWRINGFWELTAYGQQVLGHRDNRVFAELFITVGA